MYAACLRGQWVRALVQQQFKLPRSIHTCIVQYVEYLDSAVCTEAQSEIRKGPQGEQ